MSITDLFRNPSSPDGDEASPSDGLVIYSASGFGVRVANPLGEATIRSLVTPGVIARAAAARGHSELV